MIRRPMSNVRERQLILLFGIMSVAMAFSLSSCGEIDQQAKTEKVYAKNLDSRAYAGDKFKGDKAKWEEAMVQRNRTQNESIKMDSK